MKRSERLIKRMHKTLQRINAMTTSVAWDVALLEKHFKHRIAAHKAHHTMKKQQLNREGAKVAKIPVIGWTDGDRVVLTKKGEAALRAIKTTRRKISNHPRGAGKTTISNLEKICTGTEVVE